MAEICGSHDEPVLTTDLFRAVRPNGKKCADLRARVSSSMLERPLAAIHLGCLQSIEQLSWLVVTGTWLDYFSICWE